MTLLHCTIYNLQNCMTLYTSWYSLKMVIYNCRNKQELFYIQELVQIAGDV
jgi:hypothetical protein